MNHRRRRSAAAIGICFLLSALASRAGAIDCEWDEATFAPPGADGIVRSIIQFDDGSGGRDTIYLGGDFGAVGGRPARHLARGDGVEWSEVAGGLDGPVHALAVYDDGTGPALFAGGEFTTAGSVAAANIARWDGSSWSAVGSGTNDAVHALAVFDAGAGPTLYAAGDFLVAGGIAASRIARWNGVSWSTVGSGLNGTANALAVYGAGAAAALYAGGAFTSAGGAGASRIAAWNGVTWSAVGGGVDDVVRALAVHDAGGGSALYAGGNFVLAGGIGATHIARWNGSAWSDVDVGTNGVVHSMASHATGSGSVFVVGGEFTIAGFSAAPNVARFDGVSWSSFGDGVDGPVFALADVELDGATVLVAGGGFTRAGEVFASGIAAWRLARWEILGAGNGLSAAVFALAVHDDGGGEELYAGGEFTAAGDVNARYVASWDGSRWRALGAGTGGPVYAMTSFDDGAGAGLVVGGSFQSAGAVNAANVALWRNGAWHALGGGVAGVVFAVAAFDSGGGEELYAGGFFGTAGGVGAANIARWDGATWAPLGSGTNTTVRALTVFDDGSGPALHAGGDFVLAGGQGVNRVARWNGATWAPLGTGVNNRVFALGVLELDGAAQLVAGGQFVSAGGRFANRVALWDGTEWSGPGQGVDDLVLALASYDDGQGTALYAGGSFALAGGNPAASVASWDGTRWSPLSDGLDDTVQALAAYDDGSGLRLFAGGRFRRTGEGVAFYLARRSGPTLPEITAPPEDVTACAGEDVAFEVAASSSTPLFFQWLRDGEEIDGAVASRYELDAVTADDAGLYRVVVSDACGEVSSRDAQLAVLEAPSLVREPIPQTACPGGGVILEVEVAGTPPLTLEWRKDGAVLEEEMETILVLDPVEAEDAGEYTVTARNVCGEVTSAAVLVGLDVPPEFSAGPESRAVCPGEDVLLSVMVSGTPPLFLQWRRDGTEIDGATADVLVLESVGESSVGLYDVLASNTCGESLSTAAAIELIVPPAISSQPVGGLYCPASEVTLEVAAGGGGELAYQWLRDDVEIEGAVATAFTIGSLTESERGAYTCRVTNACGVVLSESAAVELLATPVVTLEPGAGRVCAGEEVVLSAQVSGIPAPALRWRKDGVPIEGATAATLTIAPATSEDAGVYSIEAVNECGAAVSEEAPLELDICFHRGDPDASGTIDLSDGIYVFNFLFLGGEEPGCLDAADADSSSRLDLSDGIYILNFLFLGGPPPADPGPPPAPCGPDPDARQVGCEGYEGC